MLEPVEQVSFLAKRVESLEDRFEDHSNKLESRMDQLVVLMQKVASLQERENNNADQIKELKERQKDLSNEHKQMNDRMHARMDRHVEEISICRDGINASLKNINSEVNLKLKEIEVATSIVKEEVNKWLNRGIGAWVIISSCLIFLQILAGYFINQIKEEHKLVTQEVKTLHDSSLHTQQEISHILTVIKEHKDMTAKGK